MLRKVGGCDIILQDFCRNKERLSDVKKVGILFVLLAGSLWGLMGLFVRWLSAHGFTSLQVASIRLTVAAVAMLAFTLVYNRSLLKFKLKDAWLFVVLGVFSMLMMTVLYFYAINASSMSIAAILLYTAPIFVMVASVIFFKEKITWQKIAALVLAFSGCVFISSGGESNVTVYGSMLAVGSGICYASYSIFSTVALRKGYHPFTVTTFAFCFAAVASYFVANPIETLSQVVESQSRDVMTVPFVILLGIVTAVAPFMLYTQSLKWIETGEAAIMASVEPLVASVAGYIAFKEKPGIFGIGLILLAVLLVNNFGIAEKQPQPSKCEEQAESL